MSATSFNNLYCLHGTELYAFTTHVAHIYCALSVNDSFVRTCIYTKGAIFTAMFREGELPIYNLNSMYGAGVHTYRGITFVTDMIKHFFELQLNFNSCHFGIYFFFLDE